MIVKSQPGSKITGAWVGSGRGGFLSGGCGAALAIACLLPSPAWADDYVVSTAAELQTAIVTANANLDPSATITLAASFSVGTLPQLAKPITIDTQGFTLLGVVLNTTGGNTLTLSGTVAAAIGAPGLYNDTNSPPSSFIVQGSIAGGAGNGSGGNAGYGVELTSTTIVNSGTISGGSTTDAGSGGVGAFLRRGSTLTNYGTVEGGDSASGAGGPGIDMGGPGALTTLINHGTIRGGSGATNGGYGVFARSGSAPIVNTGTIEGGAASSAIITNSATFNLVITNSGIIRAGAGQADAITRTTPATTGTLTLELQAGSVIEGNVIAGATPTGDILRLGGAADDIFDVSAIGVAAQYRYFDIFQKTGTSTWTLTGTGTATTNWDIQQGTLQLGNGGTSGSIVGNVTNNGTLAFNRSDTLTFGGTIIGTGSVAQVGTGTTVLTGVNGYTGGTTIGAGTLSVSNDANLGNVTGALTFNGGVLRVTGTGFTSTARTINWGAGGGFDIADPANIFTVGQALGSTGVLTKLGAGRLVLTGANSYTGATSVNAGTLWINGDQSAATGLTSVASGATLGGIGVIGGDVMVGDGGTLAPGNSPGTLTVNGDLTLASGSISSFEFGQANVVGGALNDLVDVGGDLVLDGTVNVTESVGGSFGPGVYRIINYAGALTDNGLALGTMPVGSEVFVQTAVANQVNLVNTVGLTLNFWDGAAGPKNDSVIQGGSGTWRVSGGQNNWTEIGGAVNADYAQDSFAIFGGTAGTVTVDGSGGAVRASGMQFTTDGYVIEGEALTLIGAQSLVRVGDGTAPGADYTATIAAEVAGASQLVKTDAGTLVLSGSNSYTGGTVIEGGTLQISADANLGAAIGNVALDGGTLASTASLTSARDFVVAGGGAISTASGTTFTLSGTLSGAGALTKAGAGVLLVTGNAGGFTGSTTVAGGVLDLRSSFGGAITVATGARLEGIGQADSVTNGGVVAPGDDALGTLTLAGSYTSAGGTLEIETELGGDMSATDRLVVNGGTSGNTQLIVTNRGGLGSQTIEGVKIIDVAGASDGTFVLNGDYVFEGEQAVIAGAFGYRLYQGGVSTPSDGDWYLRSTLLDPAGPEGPQGPLYQPGVPLYESYGQVLQTLNGLSTLQERVGNRQWAQSLNGSANGVWGRVESTRHRPEARISTSGADTNIGSRKFQIGIDRTVSESHGGMLVAGLTGHFGEADATVRSIFGNGSIDAQGHGLGATLTWYGRDGFYADGQVQLSWFDTSLKSSVLGGIVNDNDGSGQAYSAEIGKRSPLGGKLSVTPQIQMVYSTARFDRFIDPYGATVSSRLDDSLKTRWGLSLDRQDGRSHLYGVVNLSYEWLDGTVADVSGTSIARDGYHFWSELGVGGSVLVGGRFTLFAQASGNTAIPDFGESYSLKAIVGLRLAF